MKSNKLIFIILSILLNSIFMYSFSCMKEDLLISLVFYQIGKYSDSHIIILNKNGKGLMYYGTRDDKFDKTLEMIKIIEKKEILLNKDKIHTFFKIVNDIKKNGNLINNDILKDAWKIQIITKSNFIDVYYGELIKYSWFKKFFIEIVNSFSIGRDKFPWKMIFLRYK